MEGIRPFSQVLLKPERPGSFCPRTGVEIPQTTLKREPALHPTGSVREHREVPAELAEADDPPTDRRPPPRAAVRRGTGRSWTPPRLKRARLLGRTPGSVPLLRAGRLFPVRLVSSGKAEPDKDLDGERRPERECLFYSLPRRRGRWLY